MLNYLWAGMMALGILWGAFHGNLAQVTNGALDSAREAVTLCLTMLGIMSFWCGILKVGEEAGLIEALTKKMRPVIRLLFPDMPEDHPAAAHISTNMIAYRSQYGSVSPSAIVGPALAATAVSTLTGVAYCLLKRRR